MPFNKILTFLIVYLQTGIIFGQTLSGVVVEKSTQSPIFGASVHVLRTKVGAVTDSEGRFSLKLPKNATHLVVRFVGYGSDTLEIAGKKELKIELGEDELPAISIEAERPSMYSDPTGTQKIQIMAETELQKAACCNLAESFETNPSVDAVVTDAITGLRQIQMLGLASVYTQITQEGVPYGRGLASNMAMTMVPGSWVESIQVSKGTNSVANGYESTAGAINFELRKPFESDKIFFNLYQNNLSRREANLHVRQNVNDKLSTVLLLHADKTDMTLDMNHDHFYDMPLSTQFNVLNRWQYKAGKGWTMQAGLKALKDERESGQIHGNYKVNLKTQRQEIWTKIGKRFTPYSSFGSIVSLQNHQSNNSFGTTAYSGAQRSLHANLIYQSIISTNTHNFKIGASYQADEYRERFDSLDFNRLEQVGGVFGEYKYAPREHFDMILGLRTDYHNLFGLMVTPRFHIRYTPHPNSILRATAGRGYRTANFLAENMAAFVSQRRVFVPTTDRYPFAQENAWNWGINYTQEWELAGKEGSFSLEFYRTVFQNQVVADLDKSATELHFYNLRGLSYSNGVQADLEQQLAKKLHLRLSYRYLDVKTTLAEKLQERPLVAKHRVFANLAYSWRKWKADATANYMGAKRLPANLGGREFEGYSPAFYLVHGQISKTWWQEKLDVYVGVENALGFRQKDLIVAPQSPFSQGFDASISWGPAMGRVFYVGMRFRIK